MEKERELTYNIMSTFSLLLPTCTRSRGPNMEPFDTKYEDEDIYDFKKLTDEEKHYDYIFVSSHINFVFLLYFKLFYFILLSFGIHGVCCMMLFLIYLYDTCQIDFRFHITSKIGGTPREIIVMTQ